MAFEAKISQPLHSLGFQLLWRWLSIVLAAELSLLFINALLALVYKKYVWQISFSAHLLPLIVIWAILASSRALNRRLDRDFPWEEGLFQRLGIQTILTILIAFLVVFVFRNTVMALFSNTLSTHFIRFQDEIIVATVIVFFTMVVVLIDLGIFLMQQWQRSSTEAERVKKENLEFRFDRLRNQVNPHFLFNSLNTLASLVYQDPDTASRFVRQMAKVYRYVLENRDKEVIPLAEEWNFMEAYLYLVKIRFDDGVRFELDISKEALEKMIPPMTLQLLLENALKHNIVSASKPLTIKILTKGNRLKIENNIQPKMSPEPSTKTGLENIKSRYAILSSQPVVIESNENFFSVEIPLLQPEIC